MKTIIVPTDFSPCAEHALDYGCAIAEKTNSRIILLHVLPLVDTETSYTPGGEWMGGSWAGESSPPGAPLMMAMMKDTRKKLNHLMSLPQCKGIVIQDAVETGNVSEQINAAVQRFGADMIVMGTHGSTGLNEMLIGSNAEHVVRNAVVPVLSVKEKKESIWIDTIVFATDFSEETDLVFPAVKAFADIFNARIRLVKVLPGPSPKEQEKIKKEAVRMKEEAPGKDYAPSYYYHMNKEEGIRHFAEAVEADLIALGTHGRHGLARFFRGSIAENVVNHSSLPVLTINISKKPDQQKKAAAEDLIEQGHLFDVFYSGNVPAL